VGFQGRPDCEGAAGRGNERVRQHHPSDTNPVDGGVPTHRLRVVCQLIVITRITSSARIDV
jgi:hypothetical protein